MHNALSWIAGLLRYWWDLAEEAGGWFDRFMRIVYVAAFVLGPVGLFFGVSFGEKILTLFSAVVVFGILLVVPYRRHTRTTTQFQALTTPVFRVRCEDSVEGGRNRNRDTGLLKQGRDGSGNVVVEPAPVDFLGFVLTNPSAATVKDCHCDLIRLERKEDSKPLFREFTALPFAPREPEEDLKTKTDIRGGCSAPVALCTVTDFGKVLFGSLGQKWRFPEKFEDYFKHPGCYLFHVRISAENSPTEVCVFEFTWTGARTTCQLGLKQ